MTITDKMVEAACAAYAHAAYAGTPGGLRNSTRAALEAAEAAREVVTDAQLDEILDRCVAEGETIDFHIRPSCRIPGDEVCTRLLMHEVLRTILRGAAPPDHSGPTVAPAAKQPLTTDERAPADGGEVVGYATETDLRLLSKSCDGAVAPLRRWATPLSDDTPLVRKSYADVLLAESVVLETNHMQAVMDCHEQKLRAEKAESELAALKSTDAPQDVVPDNAICPGCGLLVFGPTAAAPERAK